MAEIKGKKHRSSVTDYPQACAVCRKLFYVSRECNGQWVICPYCGHRH